MSNVNIINRNYEDIEPEGNAILLFSKRDDMDKIRALLNDIDSEAVTRFLIYSRRVGNFGKLCIEKARLSDRIFIMADGADKNKLPEIAMELHRELEKRDAAGRTAYMEAFKNDENNIILQALLSLGVNVELYMGERDDNVYAKAAAQLEEYSRKKAAEREALMREKAKAPFAVLYKSDARDELIKPNKYQIEAAEEFANAHLYVTDTCRYSLDDIKTRIANNVLTVGSVGTGKSRNFVAPNIYEAVGSYFICDPKGQLYTMYSDYLRSKGYKVKLIDFIHPDRSDGYNPMAYVRSYQDIDKISSTIVNTKKTEGARVDPFWDNASINLVNGVIGYLFETDAEYKDFGAILELMREGARTDNDDDGTESELAKKFKQHSEMNPDSWAYQQFALVNANPAKTFNNVISTLSGKLAKLDTPELRRMMAKESLDFTEAAKTKTAVFVTVSDSDRTLDDLVNIFFSQAINELCSFADDRCENGRLPIPVRFILDDFATNCRIEEFPRMISSFRSRAISVMLMIQGESQLEQSYGKDGNTIIANCDTYIYLGSNDMPTADRIAKRCDVPYEEIASMPIGSCVVFRRGSKPVRTKLSDTEHIINEMMNYRKKGSDYIQTQ